MRVTQLFAALVMLLVAGTQAFAQSPSNDAVTFGNRLSPASVVSALQAGGYQALLAPAAPNAPAGQLANIITGIGGVKISLVLLRCDSNSDEVCSIMYLTSFNDDKRLINESTVNTLNAKTGFAKVTIQNRTNGTSGFNVVYGYVCKGFDDTKFVTMVLAVFGGDVGRVVQGYNAIAAANAAPTNQ